MHTPSFVNLRTWLDRLYPFDRFIIIHAHSTEVTLWIIIKNIKLMRDMLPAGICFNASVFDGVIWLLFLFNQMMTAISVRGMFCHRSFHRFLSVIFFVHGFSKGCEISTWPIFLTCSQEVMGYAKKCEKQNDNVHFHTHFQDHDAMTGQLPMLMAQPLCDFFSGVQLRLHAII